MPANQLTAVAVCCHDTASAVAAIPSESQEFIFLSTGTWCIVGIESATPLLSKEALELGFTNERGFNNTFRTLKNIVGLWLVQGLQKVMPNNPDFGTIDKMALQCEEPVNLVNPNDPLFYNPDNMLEAFDRYFEKTNQAKPASYSAYFKCAYNSLCLSINFYVEKIEELTGKKHGFLHIIGGGSQSVYFCQTLANVSGKKVVAGPVEATALGNILVQAIANNKISNLQQGRQLVKQSFPTQVYSTKQQKRNKLAIRTSFHGL
ncbi:MAG: hypothetical protein HC896_11570 [Bacteroidales bacterium]|nr:hypothetical protein [Bacteroidales bacterium]